MSKMSAHLQINCEAENQIYMATIHKKDFEDELRFNQVIRDIEGVATYGAEYPYSRMINESYSKLIIIDESPYGDKEVEVRFWQHIENPTQEILKLKAQIDELKNIILNLAE